jgi:DNA-binding MarR family transcriptional regulator
VSEGRYAKCNWALSWGEVVPEFIFKRARLLSKAVTAICDDRLRPFGINSPQFALLIAICRREPITRAEVARLEHLNKSTLTRDLKTALSEGWIEEVRDGANGRSRPVALTGAGKELMLIAQPAWLTAQVQAEALLGEDGMIALVSITDRILDHSTSKASVSNAESRAAVRPPHQ